MIRMITVLSITKTKTKIGAKWGPLSKLSQIIFFYSYCYQSIDQVSAPAMDNLGFSKNLPQFLITLCIRL